MEAPVTAVKFITTLVRGSSCQGEHLALQTPYSNVSLLPTQNCFATPSSQGTLVFPTDPKTPPPSCPPYPLHSCKQLSHEARHSRPDENTC